MYPSTTQNPQQTPIYICRHTVNAHFSQLTNTVLTLHALTVACSGVHCGLNYQHWPMKQSVAVDQKGCQWHTAPIKFRQN